MRLNSQWILGVRQDFQQLVVAEKVQSRKDDSLRLQIIGETFLHDV
jgi:hypothetical protein